MGSYKYGYKSLKWVIAIAALLISPLITIHEPPSSVVGRRVSSLGLQRAPNPECKTERSSGDEDMKTRDPGDRMCTKMTLTSKPPKPPKP